MFNTCILCTTYDMPNWNKSIILIGVIGKGLTGLLKLCSVLGLSSLVAKYRFTEHLKVFEEKAFILRNENLKEATSPARDLTITEQNVAHSSEVVDMPTSFDGTCSSRG